MSDDRGAYVGEEMEDQQTKGSQQHENENHDLTFFSFSSIAARTIDCCRNNIIIEDTKTQEKEANGERERQKKGKKNEFLFCSRFSSYHSRLCVFIYFCVYFMSDNRATKNSSEERRREEKKKNRSIIFRSSNFSFFFKCVEIEKFMTWIFKVF